MVWISWYALKVGAGRRSAWAQSGGRTRNGHTYSTIVTGKAKLLKDHLITIGLQGGQGIRLLGQEQPRLGRVAFLRGVLVEELMVPYLLLGFPVDRITLLDGPPEGDLAKVLAFRQVGCDVCLSRPVACDAVRYHARLVDGAVGIDKAGLEGVRAVVEDKCAGWRRRRSRFRFPGWHVDVASCASVQCLVGLIYLTTCSDSTTRSEISTRYIKRWPAGIMLLITGIYCT